MKNTLLQFGLTFALTWLLQLFLPWWSLVIAALVIGAILQPRPVLSFAVGLLSVAAVWLLVAFFLTRTEAQRILPVQMGEILGGLSYMNLLIATVTLGGIMGGLGALTGTLGRKLIVGKQKSVSE
ncbi:MAG: hypothetical protein AAGI23_07270 [Bacteroidota bacterium]